MALHTTKTSSISLTENFISSSLQNIWTRVKDFELNLNRAVAKKTYSDEKRTVLSYYYNKIINLVQQYENCKVTILETPVYSIYHWNCHRKHKSPDEFKDQDSTLADQVIRLKTKVKELNDGINSHSPKFSNDLQIKSKYKKRGHITPATRTQYNFNLYTDGVHPDNLLAKTWLKKIVDKAQLNCSHQ